jgi:hypothetical protein
MMFQQTGDELFREQHLELACGKHLGRIDIGIGFNYLNDQATGYGSIPFISATIGLRFRVSERLTTGWAFGLPFLGYSGKTYPEKAPQYFRMGFGYHAEIDLLLSCQLEKQSGQAADLFACIEYRYAEHFIFSAGVHSAAGSFVFESGWCKNRLCIKPGLVYEPALGFSPGLTLLWETKNKTE